jgi:iron complex outermembrane receptor protein
MTLSGSYGTSFRAPNLRDAFLAPQQAGTSSRNDPCTIPAAAAVGGVYIAANDTRSQTVMDNCVANGADPTMLGLSANVTIPVTLGGNALDLKPETSRAYTATLLLSPPVSEAFDFDIAVSFFDIRIEDTIRSIAPESILNRCFDSVGLTSDLCSRVQRGNNPNPQFNFITFIDASFVNIGEETSQGVDVNTRFSTMFDDFMGDSALEAIWTTAVTFQTKRTEQVFTDEAAVSYLGDYGVPKTRIQSNFAFIMGDWQANFETRWIQGTGPSQDALSNVDFQCPGPNGVPAVSTSYPGSPSVFLVCDAGGRIYQDVSLSRTLNGNVRLTAGVNNLFDKQPPLISASLGSNRGNRLTSSGYDQIGRSYFISLTAAF